jgi:hypothetical protein
VRVVEGVREREKGEKKRTGMCNEWQVGNFETQKQPKAGSKVLSILYYAKAAFDFAFCGSQPPLVGLLAFGKSQSS